MARAELQPGERVLDVPCGRGASLFLAAERVGPEGSVLGVDLAEEMVEMVTADIMAGEVANAEVARMDAEALDLADGSVDVVLSGFGFHLMPDPVQAATETRRVLRPGGRLVCANFSGAGPEWDFLGEVFKEFAPRLVRPMHLPLRPDFDLEATLTEARFDDVDIVEETLEFTFTDDGAWWDWAWSHGMREFFELLDGGALEEMRQRMAGHLGALQGPRGIAYAQRAEFALATPPG